MFFSIIFIYKQILYKMMTKNPLSKKNNMSDPMNLLTDERNRSQYIETVQVYPRFIQDGIEGGSMSLVLPKKKAYLSSESRLVIPCTNIDRGFQFPPNMGIYALFESITLRTESGGVICQLNNASDFYALNNLLTSPSRMYKRDSILHGMNFSFEGGSGSKMNNVKSESEILPGQMRLKGEFYETMYPAPVVGRENAKPNCLSTQSFLNLQTDYKDTAEFSIPLLDLLYGMFKVKSQFPIALISDELILDINFTKNGNYGNNDRAVFCPALSTAPKSTIVSGSMVAGAGRNGPVQNSIAADKVGSMRVMFDVSSQNAISNITILDGGRGYNENSQVTFTGPFIDVQNPLVLTPSRNFVQYSEGRNFAVQNGGNSNLAVGNILTVINPSNSALNFKIKVTGTTPQGAMTSCELLSKDENDNIYIPVLTPLSIMDEDGDPTQVVIVAYDVIYSFTSDGSAFEAFNEVNLSGVQSIIKPGIVLSVSDEGSNITSVGTTFDVTVEKDQNIWEIGDVTNVTQVKTDPTKLTLTKINGLGYDPVYSFDDDRFRDRGRINIVTDKVYLSTDLIYYLDGKTERKIDEMQTKGYTQLYTQFIDVITSTSDDTEIDNYNVVASVETARQIGFSNEVLRGVVFAVSPAGKQTRQEFPYYDQPKINPLLNKYCSMSSLQKDGFEFQINCNSVPYYSTPVTTEYRMFTELSKCMGVLNIPKCCYTAWDACRQLDNPDTVSAGAPSLQPGFTTLDKSHDGYFIATKKYEINERKMGVCNQLWQGIPQKWLLGMSHYNGVSFKYMDDESVPRNGLVIGNNSVDISYIHNSTFNPWYSDSFRMALFGEVERIYTIQNGVLRVTSSTF